MFKNYLECNSGDCINVFFTKWLLNDLSNKRGYSVSLDELQQEFKDSDYHIGINGQLYENKNTYCWYVDSKYDIIKNNNGRWELVYQLRPDEE